MIHKLRPNALIGNNHHVAPFAGEDFQMFEQDLPGKNTAGFNTADVSRLPLETCRTINNSSGWNKCDTAFRPLEQQIRYLVEAAGRGANLLLNVGPRPDGTFPPEAVEILRSMGQWLEKSDESIYGTRTGPWDSGQYGYCVRRGKRAYLHVLEWPGTSELLLPKLAGVKSATILGCVPMQVEAGADGIALRLPGGARNPVGTIVAVDFDRGLAGASLQPPRGK